LQRKLFISKLPKIHTDPEVDLRRAELERAFRKYGGDRGVTVVVPKNATFAFVEMESERQADLALQEMTTQYRVNRARRTRHEALQEERAAAEAAKQGKPKQNADWD
jgi:RNA recognition motif-containing protein